MLMANKIVHLMNWDRKFVPNFIDFINQNFSNERHCFVIYGDFANDDVPRGANVVVYSSLFKYFLEISCAIGLARKIILHGLFSSHILCILTLNPWILKKCYWIIWGADLYIHNSKNNNWRWYAFEILRRFLISRIGNFVTHIKGDYELAQQWYGAKGEWHECFMYPSNLYQNIPQKSLPHEGINFLLGNSADPSNNHIEVLDRLKCHSGENVKIYCPLSYGNQAYAQKISDYGVSLFCGKFVPLRDFMSLEEYTKFLAEIDVAIFNHGRQQGMGNITTLLGMGKKVYLRKEITTWKFLENLKIKVFEVDSIDGAPMSTEASLANKTIVARYFSKDNLISQLGHIFR